MLKIFDIVTSGASYAGLFEKSYCYPKNKESKYYLIFANEKSEFSFDNN